MKKSILNLTLDQLEAYCLVHGQKSYRAKQLMTWLYRKRVTDFDQMTDLPAAFIQQLRDDFVIDILQVDKCQVSSDGTRKYLFKSWDDQYLETVLMTFDYGQSVCVTTQIGCSMGCRFCASGLVKKQRDLSVAEIVDQVLMIQRDLDKEEGRVSNIVVMGIGEPFDNYANVKNFVSIINHDLGLAIGARRITISTCGLVPRIYQFADEESQINLAISLHAPNDALRKEIMPIARTYSLDQLFEAINYYLEKNNRRLTLEYILIKDVNDGIDQAMELVDRVKGLNAYVNLIPYNPVDENPYQKSDFKQQLAFYDTLMKHGVKATLRKEMGSDIDAACGQLRVKRIKEKA